MSQWVVKREEPEQSAGGKLFGVLVPVVGGIVLGAVVASALPYLWAARRDDYERRRLLGDNDRDHT